MSTPGQSHAAWYLSKLSLRQQVFALIVLITLVAGGLKAVSGHHQAREAADEEAELRAKALLDVSVVMTVDHLKSGEVDRAESAIKDLMAGSGMERVEMQDPARQRVVTFVWQGRPSDASGSRRVVMSVGEQGTLLTEPGPSPHPVEVTVDGATYLWVTRPLQGLPGEPLLGVMFSNADIVAHESEMLREQLLLGLGFTVLVAVVVLALLSRTLQPVARLARHMREFRAEGGGAWTEQASSRDVAEIAAAYESMRLRLQQQMHAMRVGHELLSATLDTAPNGVVVVNSQGRVRMANRAARRQFLIAGDQDQGESGPRIEWLLPDFDLHQDRHSRLGVFSDAQGSRCMARALNGQHFVAQVQAATLNVDGVPDQVLSVRDITREEDASRQIQLRTQRLHSVLTLSNEGIVLFSAQRQLVFANPQMQQYLSGIDAARLSNLPLRVFEHMLAQGSTAARPYLPLDENSPATPLTFALAGPPARVLTRTWRPSEGGDKELVMFFQDITEQEEVAHLKSEFLSAAAHELRTPLTSILGFSDLMLQHELPAEEQRELLQTIRDQSALLVNIINEMLDLSRIESRRGQDFKPRACPVPEACRLAAASVHPPGDPRQVVQQHEDGLLQVWSDPEKLHQVLVNLLSNAYKFSPEGGSIELRSRRAQRGDTPVALIEVQDQGIGMGPAELAHVFERFFRADKSGHIPGTGLGLSLVKQIVELSGGQIHLHSQPGQGTRVEITLPLAADAPLPPLEPIS